MTDNDPLGADADVALEQPMQRAYGEIGSAREILGARDGSILLDEPDEPIGERHRLRA